MRDTRFTIQRIREALRYRAARLHPKLPMFVDAAVAGEIPRKRVNWVRDAQVVPPDSVRYRIPKEVHQTWTTNRFGRTHAQGLLQFRQENPEFTFRIWSPSECDEFVRTDFGHHPISEVYFRAKFGPLAADIWRYLVLLKFGGWYFDINKRVTGGLLQFMSPDCELVLSYERNLFSGDTSLSQGIDHPQNAVCNWGIGAAPDNPVLQRLIADICEDTPLFSGRVWPKPKEAIIDYTGPRRLTRTLHKFVGQFGAAGICQAGIDFHGQGDFDMAGSWVRYLTNPPYAAARDQPILT